MWPTIRRWLTATVRKVRNWFYLNALLLAALLTVELCLPRPMEGWQRELLSFSINFLTGGLISFLFYFLVVYLPAKRRRDIIKHNLKRIYRDIKKDILRQVVFSSIAGGRHDLTTDTKEVERLMEVDAFKAAFAHGREADEGFYAFENQMMEETYEFRQIILSLSVLSKQIEYVLHNYAIEDQKVFDFFKRLEAFLLRMQHLQPG